MFYNHIDHNQLVVGALCRSVDVLYVDNHVFHEYSFLSFFPNLYAFFLSFPLHRLGLAIRCRSGVAGTLQLLVKQSDFVSQSNFDLLK